MMANLLPDSGGGDAPVGAYRILDSGPDVELLGATDSRDVQFVLAQALPSNVIFTLRFLPEVFEPNYVAEVTGQFAGYFNAMKEIPGVSGVTTFQDVNDDDVLNDVMRIRVRSTSGATSFPIEDHQFGRRLDYVAEDVAAARANLDAIEAGH
jgi:hypothetical protein